jgi:predicted transposase YdaD
LRGLCKDKILTKAFANISELPVTKRERNDIVEVCIKHFKYLSEKSSVSGLTQEEEDFMKTMQEIDTLYRAEMNRARLEGQLQGEREGELKGQQELVLRLLKRRVGNLSSDLETRVRALPLARLEALGEALLDFTRMEDAIAWFEM